MVSTGQKKNEQKAQPSHLGETLNDFVIGNSVNVNVSGSGNLERQTNGQLSDFEWVSNIARRNQVLENNIGNQFAKVVTSAVMSVKNRMHDAVFTAINMGISRVEIVVKLIKGSKGQGTNSEN